MVSLLVGCASGKLAHGPVPNPAQNNFSYWVVKHVDVSDGVERYEASFIAGAFFTSGVSGCGAPGEPKKEGEYWVVPTRVGFAAEPGENIFVRIKTGDVKYNGEVTTFSSLQNIKLLDLPKVDI